MYSSENYMWGLIGYYLGVLLVLAAAWRASLLVPWKHPRQLLLLSVAVILLLPVKAYPDLPFLAPAFFVAIFESLTSPEPDAYLRGLVPLIVSYLAALLIYVGCYGYLWWRAGRRTTQPEEEDHAPT